MASLAQRYLCIYNSIAQGRRTYLALPYQPIFRPWQLPCDLSVVYMKQEGIRGLEGPVDAS